MALRLMAVCLYMLLKGENEEMRVLPSVVLILLKLESIFMDFIFFFLLDKILTNLFEGRISTIGSEVGLMWGKMRMSSVKVVPYR